MYYRIKRDWLLGYHIYYLPEIFENLDVAEGWVKRYNKVFENEYEFTVEEIPECTLS